MPYTIRTCIDCGQKIHIQQKGKTVYLKNRCIHFSKSTITVDQLEQQTVPLSHIIVPTINPQDIPFMCARHKVPMNFVQYLQKFTELHYCPKCAVTDKLIPAKIIAIWKKKTWNKKWHPGEVRLIVSPDYETMIKQGWIKV